MRLAWIPAFAGMTCVSQSTEIPSDISGRTLIAKENLFAPTQDSSYFVKKMRIAPDRLGLEWPNCVDFSADGLRFRAFPEEAEAEFGASAAHSDTEPVR